MKKKKIMKKEKDNKESKGGFLKKMKQFFLGTDSYEISSLLPVLNKENGSAEKVSPLKWRLETGCYVHFSPTIAQDGTVYFGHRDNYLYALNPPDGSLKWKFETGNFVFSSPSISSDGTIYFGSNDNYLYALNPPDGSLKWKFKTGANASSSPAIAVDGTIYFGSWDNYLYAIDTKIANKYCTSCIGCTKDCTVGCTVGCTKSCTASCTGCTACTSCTDCTACIGEINPCGHG